MVERHGPQEWFLGTWTFRGRAPTIYDARRSWDNLRKNVLWRYHRPCHFFQAWENWQPDAKGRIHCHAIIKGSGLETLPDVPNGMSRRRRMADLSEGQARYTTRVEGCGFGWVTSLTPLMRGPGGAYNYVTKQVAQYITKGWNAGGTRDNRRVQRWSFSRGAHGVQQEESDGIWTKGWYDLSDEAGRELPGKEDVRQRTKLRLEQQPIWRARARLLFEWRWNVERWTTILEVEALAQKHASRATRLENAGESARDDLSKAKSFRERARDLREQLNPMWIPRRYIEEAYSARVAEDGLSRSINAGV